MIHSDLENIERLEELEDVIKELKELSEAGAIIIVEGRKDVESLRHLGINGEIRLASQQPLLEFSESLLEHEEKLVLLTDWDKKGGLIARKIIKYLLAYGVMPDTNIRSRLRSLSKKRIKDIQSLNHYINNLRYEIHGIREF